MEFGLEGVGAEPKTSLAVSVCMPYEDDEERFCPRSSFWGVGGPRNGLSIAITVLSVWASIAEPTGGDGVFRSIIWSVHVGGAGSC